MKYKSVDEIETLSFRDATLIRCIYSEKQGILEFEFDGAVVREDNSANELYTDRYASDMQVRFTEPITEPLEFSFLFVAPALFAVQVVLAGSAYMIAHMLNVAVGLTFSGGLLDFFLFGILQGNAKTSWMRVIPVGIIYFFLYYFIFKFMIRKFNFKTPGREDDDTETRLYTKADVNARREAAQAETVASAYGDTPYGYW